MREIKEEMLSDAIHTALGYSEDIIKLKKIIATMAVIIVLLICGYFL